MQTAELFEQIRDLFVNFLCLADDETQVVFVTGNRTRAAELLGMSVRTLRNKLNGPARDSAAG